MSLSLLAIFIATCLKALHHSSGPIKWKVSQKREAKHLDVAGLLSAVSAFKLASTHGKGAFGPGDDLAWSYVMRDTPAVCAETAAQSSAVNSGAWGWAGNAGGTASISSCKQCRALNVV